ncbi:MAG TPA: efflux RND transporter periplasmic adaptor subunit [Bryobacteraceae bacterium]|nr:efflux RND transporter periplasmic adaptor subunit [Bryobacteraceae bacterium]
MQPKSKLSAIACAISLAGILTVVGCNARESAETVSASSAEPGAARVPAVRTVEAVTRPIAASVQVTGSFVAKETSDVAPEAAGRVVETFVNVGDFVKEGQVIVRFEDRDAQLRLEQAKASEQQAEALLRQAQSRIGLDEGRNFNPDNVPEVLSAKATFESALGQAKLAKADAQRYENLIKTGDVSRSAYERERTQAETAEAQANSARQMYEAALNSARQNYQGVLTAQASLAAAHAQTALAQKAVQDTVVRAPFPGFISARPVAAGQYVALTSKIATLLRITPIKLDLQVPESNAPQLRLGVTVEANAPGFPGRVFQGKVTALNPAVDPNSRTFSVEAEFPNLDVALKPGMFGTARIFLTGATDGIFIPTEAILTDATTNSSQVFFLRDGKARVAVVQLGAKDGGMTQILSGLSAGAVVATDHLQDLYDGETVQTAPARNAAASAKQGN